MSVGQIWLDVRHAARSLRKRPIVTVAAFLSLAIGIGVNTAMFSVFERIMLRRLAVPEPDRIVILRSPGRRPGGTSTGNAGGRDYVFSLPLFRELEAIQSPIWPRLAAHRDFDANLGYEGESERGQALAVSGGYFPALDVGAALGRVLAPEDDHDPEGRSVAVLSFQYWSSRFGSDRSVIGRTLLVNGRPLTIVGVAREGFQGTAVLDSPKVFVPLSLREPLQFGGGDRRTHWLYVFGRLNAGTSRQQAQAAMDGPFRALIREVEFPNVASELDPADRARFLDRLIIVEDGARATLVGQRSDGRAIFALALGVTGLVLLIACANLANLTLARGADRLPEIALRQSLGASAASVIRLFLIEASLLGMAGGIGGFLAARATLQTASALLPPAVSTLAAFEINATVLTFTLVVSLGTALLFGLFPALHSVRRAGTGPATGYGGQIASTRSARRFRTTIATGQIALATALLGLASLLAVSLGNVAREDLGIKPQGLVTFGLTPYLNGYDGEQAQALIERVQRELEALPSVSSAAATTMPVMAGGRARNYVMVEGFEPGPDADMRANFARTAPGYFQTLGIRLLAGREFASTDVAGAPKVAVINETFARLFRLGPNPIGKRLGLGRGETPVFDITIVGLVADAKYSQIAEPAGPQLFLPLRQAAFGPVTIYARSESDPRAVMGAVPAILRRLDAALPVERLRTMEEQVRENAAPRRALAWVSSGFAGIATLLAAVGLYGLLSYAVTQRLREIGIRVALGATRVAIWRLIFSDLGWMLTVGTVAGSALAIALGRLGRSMLFGVDAYDAGAVARALAVIFLAGLAAGAIPARRAARVNPARALRFE